MDDLKLYGPNGPPDPSAKNQPADWFADVLAFHAKFGCYTQALPKAPGFSIVQLRERLIDEEIRELKCAMTELDLPGVADAIADAIYVLLGTAISYGIDLRPVWNAVHAANMRKVGGGTRPDGKVLKPEGWEPPDVPGLLEAQAPICLPICF